MQLAGQDSRGIACTPFPRTMKSRAEYQYTDARGLDVQTQVSRNGNMSEAGPPGIQAVEAIGKCDVKDNPGSQQIELSNYRTMAS